MTCELCEVLLTVPYYIYIYFFFTHYRYFHIVPLLDHNLPRLARLRVISFIHASVLGRNKAAEDESNDMPVQPTGTLQLFDAIPNMAPIHSKPYD